MKFSAMMKSVCLLSAVFFVSCATKPDSAQTEGTTEEKTAKPNPTNGGASWRPGDAMAPTSEPFDTSAESVYENVHYASQSDTQQCDIYVPNGSGSFPVIALVHGGGFAFQNQKMPVVAPVAKYALSHGYAVVSIDYRKSSEATFPAALSDVKAAIRFIRAHAEEYKLDADKITVWGESAGAYLSVMTALTPSVAELDGDVTDNAGVSSAVNTVVDFYGPIEFFTMDAEFAALGKDGTTYSLENSFESKFLGQAIGSDKATAYRTYWETYKDALPADFALKAWIQAGTGDFAVPCTQSANLADRLSALISADNVHFSTIEGARHMDSAFYTDENIGAVFTFLDNANSL